MKIKINNKKYKYITDDSRIIDKDGAFLLTHHNKKYKKDVEKKNCINFLTVKNILSDWNLSKIKIIGITGTNGKTTTTNIIAHILKKTGQKVIVSGTEGIFLHSKNTIKKIVSRTHTSPEILTTLTNLKKAKELGVDYFIMEVSSHGIFQKRIEGLKFSAKVFTNLSQDHLDFHKTMTEYARVKSSFFEDKKTIKIINLDDKLIKYNLKNSKTYSLKNKKSDLYANNFNFSDGITTDIFYKLNNKIKKNELNSQMIGKFNLYNILAAILTIKSVTKLKMTDILEYLSDFNGIAGRMELLKEYQKKGFKMKILSDYAHTPDAIKNILESLDKNNKIITIIGAGGDRDISKRPLMAKVASENSSFLFLTSDNPRSEDPCKIITDMEKGIGNNFKNYKIVVDRKKAIKEALKMAKNFLEKKESIIVAMLGKGDENYIEIMEKKIPYSDREEVYNFFEK